MWHADKQLCFFIPYTTIYLKTSNLEVNSMEYETIYIIFIGILYFQIYKYELIFLQDISEGSLMRMCFDLVAFQNKILLLSL